MEIKTSKIKSVEVLPSWSNSNGTFYPHKVTFDNNEIAIANKKKERAFAIGQEIKYQITGQDNIGNLKFKEVQDQPYTGGSGKKGSNASFALSYSKDLVIGDKVTIEQILPTASKLLKWLNEN